MRPLSVCLLAAFVLAACGDSSTGSDGASISGSVSAFGFNQHPVSAFKNGDMTVTLTWGNPAIDLDLYLTASTCAGYPPITCDILRFSDDVGTNVEQVTYPVQNGDQLKIWVDNFDELLASSYQIQVDID